MKKPAALFNVTWAIGFGLVGLGAFMLSPAWAFIVLGSILMTVATFGAIR